MNTNNKCFRSHFNVFFFTIYPINKPSAAPLGIQSHPRGKHIDALKIEDNTRLQN